MDRSEISNWTIIYTDHTKDYIHLDHLQKSNPDAQILCADIFFGITEKKYAWRNGDKTVRMWLQNNIGKIISNNIALFEWDVLVSTKLPDIDINGLYAKNVRKPDTDPNWPWFKEIESLGSYKNYAIGVAPLGVLFMDKQCINTIIDPEFDDIYSKDIFSELRLPTILNSRNIPISKYDFPDVVWTPTTYDKNKPGIYHAIKTKQPL